MKKIEILKGYLRNSQAIRTQENVCMLLPEIGCKTVLEFLNLGNTGEEDGIKKAILKRKEEIGRGKESIYSDPIYYSIFSKRNKKVQNEAEKILRDKIMKESDSNPSPEFFALILNDWRLDMYSKMALQIKAKKVVFELTNINVAGRVAVVLTEQEIKFTHSPFEFSQLFEVKKNLSGRDELVGFVKVENKGRGISIVKAKDFPKDFLVEYEKSIDESLGKLKESIASQFTLYDEIKIKSDI